jgi:hypothetical protein
MSLPLTGIGVVLMGNSAKLKIIAELLGGDEDEETDT